LNLGSGQMGIFGKGFLEGFDECFSSHLIAGITKSKYQYECKNNTPNGQKNP